MEFYLETLEHHKTNYVMLISCFEHMHENSDYWVSESILKIHGYLLNVKYRIYS